MAANTKTPTARKGPVSLSISLNGSTKTKPQRNASPAQPPKKNQQQRRMSAFQDPPMASNKRKIGLENKSFPNEAKARGPVATAPHLETAMPLKRQKAEIEEPNTQSNNAPNFPLPTPSLTPESSTSPLHESSPNASSRAIQIPTTLLSHVLQMNPKLLPANPSTSPITSFHIDAIAHIMWQVAFNHGDLLQCACQYGSLFSPLKLAALAKLNFLPSWWFFRDLALEHLKGVGVREGWVVDDGDMEGVWGDAVRWCVGVRGEREKMKGEGEEDGDEILGE